MVVVIGVAGSGFAWWCARWVLEAHNVRLLLTNNTPFVRAEHTALSSRYFDVTSAEVVSHRSLVGRFAIESIAIEPVLSAAWNIADDVTGDVALTGLRNDVPHMLRIVAKHTTFYFAARRREVQLELLEAVKALEVAESARQNLAKDMRSGGR